MTHYNVKWLQQQVLQGNKVEYLFWGHTNKAGEPVGRFLFSQWYPSPFTVDGVTYQTAEHWMMAGKARLFGDAATLEKILQAETPKEAKALGREVKGFVAELWEEKCFDLVVEGNRHKFSRNPEYKAFLLLTGDRILVEASPVDTVWGNGLPQDHQHARDPQNWRGRNLLGFALMQVRDIFRRDA